MSGLVLSTHRIVRTTLYAVDSEASREKKLVIEHAVHKAFQLVSRKSLEETTDKTYRFAVTAVPGAKTDLAVREEQTTEKRIPLGTVDDALAQRYLDSDQVADNVKEVFRQLLSRKREQLATETTILQQREAIRDIANDQTRIRENMQALDKTSELYQQYMRTLTEQEVQLEQLTRHVQELERSRVQQEAALDRFIREASA